MIKSFQTQWHRDNTTLNFGLIDSVGLTLGLMQEVTQFQSSTLMLFEPTFSARLLFIDSDLRFMLQAFLCQDQHEVNS